MRYVSMKNLLKLLSVCFIFIFSIKANATSEIYMLSPDIPAEVTEFANEVVDEQIAAFMTGNTNENIYIDNYSSLFMGTGFYAFNQETGQPITNITYFPIFEENRYVLTLIIMNNNEGLNYSISNAFAESFNNLSYNTLNTPYALLYDGNKTNYLLTESGQILFQGIQPEETATYSTPLSLQTLLSNNKVQNITQETFDINEQTILTNIPPTLMTINPQGFSINDGTTVRLDMSYCLLKQDTPVICWAACLGTAYRYRTGNRTVTSTSIRNMLGLPNSGISATIEYQLYNALNVAGNGNSYNFTLGFARPFYVQHNINNMFPFPAHTDGHDVLIEGYRLTNGAIQVYFWDPYDGVTALSSSYNDTSSQKVFLYGAGKTREWHSSTLIK